jgi:hypothetical protein
METVLYGIMMEGLESLAAASSFMALSIRHFKAIVGDMLFILLSSLVESIKMLFHL